MTIIVLFSLPNLYIFQYIYYTRDDAYLMKHVIDILVYLYTILDNLFDNDSIYIYIYNVIYTTWDWSLIIHFIIWWCYNYLLINAIDDCSIGIFERITTIFVFHNTTAIWYNIVASVCFVVISKPIFCVIHTTTFKLKDY